MSKKTKIAIFASGTGTNFEAIATAIDQQVLQAEIVLVVCDQLDASVISKAQKRAIPTLVFTAADYASKVEYETMLLAALQEAHVTWLVLAGYMRIIGQTLLTAFPNHIVNIHPSLLPKYKGKDAIEQAFLAQETIFGVTIHYVDAGMDTGAMIAQEAFSVTPTTPLTTITKRVHEIEHQLYPTTLAKLLSEGERK